MSFEQIVQTFDAGGRIALDGFGNGHFDALAQAERSRVFELAASRVPPGQYDELAMQALGKVDLPAARALLERKLVEAPNAVCRAVTIAALLDATADKRYETALIELLGSEEWQAREKAFSYLVLLDPSSTVTAAFKQRLLIEERGDLRTQLASALIYRLGAVPRGRIDRTFVAWSERLAAPDAAERRRALGELEAAAPRA